LDVHFRVPAADRKVHRHRRIAVTARLRDHGVAHGVDYVGIRDRPADLVERDDLHAERIRLTDSAETFRPETTRTAGAVAGPSFPASAAATVTAADGSIRY